MGVRTKGVLLIFTLFTLLCPGSALIDQDQMEELRENIKKLRKEAARKMADGMLDYVFMPDVLGGVVNLLNNLPEQLHRVISDKPLLQEILHEFIVYVQGLKSYVRKELENETVKFRGHEEQLRELERLITNLADKNK